MQITVITGPRASGKSTLALELLRRTAGCDFWIFTRTPGLGEHDPATFKCGVISAKAVLISRAERIKVDDFLNVAGRLKDRSGDLVMTANLDGLPDDHWLMKVIRLDGVKYIALSGAPEKVIRSKPCKTRPPRSL